MHGAGKNVTKVLGKVHKNVSIIPFIFIDINTYKKYLTVWFEKGD